LAHEVLDEQGSRGQFKKIGIVNPSTASELTHLTIMDLVFFDDISALHQRFGLLMSRYLLRAGTLSFRNA